MTHITKFEINAVQAQSGQLNIWSTVTLSNGEAVEYFSENEIENLASLNNIGGTCSSEFRGLLGDDYLDVLADKLIDAAKKKFGTLGKLLEEAAKTESASTEITLDALESAIEKFKSVAGPVTFSATDKGDSLTLDAVYPIEAVNKNGDPLDDEPWSEFGGWKILEAAGYTGGCGNAGSDHFVDKFGDTMITQWVTFEKDARNACAVDAGHKSELESKEVVGFYNFFPDGESETIPHIPACYVFGKPDKFGCIKTSEGLYVPTTPPKAVGSDTPSPDFKGDIFSVTY